MARLALIFVAAATLVGLSSAPVIADDPPQTTFEFNRNQSPEEIYDSFVETAVDACRYALVDKRAPFAVSGSVLNACVQDLLDQAVDAAGRTDLAVLNAEHIAASPWPQERPSANAMVQASPR